MPNKLPVRLHAFLHQAGNAALFGFAAYGGYVLLVGYVQPHFFLPTLLGVIIGRGIHVYNGNIPEKVREARLFAVGDKA